MVNRTGQANTLFTAASQGGSSLPVDAGAALDMVRISLLESPNGTWNDQPQSALAAPFTGGNLDITQEFLASWQDWITGKWIYSYTLTIKAVNHAVTAWNIGFGDLPVNTVLEPGFVDTFTGSWGEVIKDGSDGSVLLASASGHAIAAGADLDVHVQVLYENRNSEQEHLNSLNAQEGASSGQESDVISAVRSGFGRVENRLSRVENLVTSQRNTNATMLALLTELVGRDCPQG
ncbi:hypothetical protein ACFXPJ_41470 [Streptomyces goshikiensis]